MLVWVFISSSVRLILQFDERSETAVSGCIADTADRGSLVPFLGRLHLDFSVVPFCLGHCLRAVLFQMHIDSWELIMSCVGVQDFICGAVWRVFQRELA